MSWNQKKRPGVTAMLEKLESNRRRHGSPSLKPTRPTFCPPPLAPRGVTPQLKEKVLSPITHHLSVRDPASWDWGCVGPVFLPSKLQRSPEENRIGVNRLCAEETALEQALTKLGEELSLLEGRRSVVEGCIQPMRKCMQLRKTEAKAGVKFPDGAQGRLKGMLGSLIESVETYSANELRLNEAKRLVTNSQRFLRREIEEKERALVADPHSYSNHMPDRYFWHNTLPDSERAAHPWEPIMVSNSPRHRTVHRIESALFRGGGGVVLVKQPCGAAFSTHRHDSMMDVLHESQSQRGFGERVIAQSAKYAQNTKHDHESERQRVIASLKAAAQAKEVEMRAVEHSKKRPIKELTIKSCTLQELQAMDGTKMEVLAARQHQHEIEAKKTQVCQVTDEIAAMDAKIKSLQRAAEGDHVCIGVLEQLLLHSAEQAEETQSVVEEDPEEQPEFRRQLSSCGLFSRTPSRIGCNV